MKIICSIGITALLLVSFSSCNNQSKSQEEEIQICDTIHNAKNSLDWAGIYKGITPCADCEGIEVEIIINADETYQISYLYIGKGSSPYVSSGNFVWDDNGSIIILDLNNAANHYLVGENTLTQLDNEKNVIESEFAEMYVLKKQ